MKKAAPDVDLRSRGFSYEHLAFTGLLLAGAVYLYNRESPSGKDQAAVDPAAKPEDEILNPPWSLLWMFVKGVYGLFLGLLGLAVVLLLLLVWRQRTIIYVPTPPGTWRKPRENHYMYQSPANWNLPYEDVYITTEDGVKINAWLIYQKAPVKPPYTFVYFHGNAGNIGHRLENLRDMYSKLQANILILDYRAYGESEDGDGPSERGFMLDAMAAYRWLVDRIRNPPVHEPVSMTAERIMLFGRSIGGVVATRLNALVLQEHLGGSDLPLPAGIVLENTFTSLREMAIQIFPFLYVLKPILRYPLIFDEWNSIAAVEYACQRHNSWCCCLMSGLQDQLVPPEQMRELHAYLKRRPPMVLKKFDFRDGGHNDTPNKCHEPYWASFQKFMGLVEANEDERKKSLDQLG
mmetsp:Transcript_158576/g.280036  ORF Transcript_158576/g.280036 Transcript_158576/m.280036 type:complete len:406 (-) Transcript_158576:65-1282(-)